MRSKMRFAGGTALAWIILAQPALGATVSISSATGQARVVYRAEVGELNNVSIVEAPEGVFMIADLTQP